MSNSTQNTTSSHSPHSGKGRKIAGSIIFGLLGSMILLCLISQKCRDSSEKKENLKGLETIDPEGELETVDSEVREADENIKKAIKKELRSNEINDLLKKASVIPCDKVFKPPLTSHEINTIKKYGKPKIQTLLREYSTLDETLTASNACTVLVAADPDPDSFIAYSHLSYETNPEDLFCIIYKNELKNRVPGAGITIMELSRKKAICDCLRAFKVFDDTHLIKNLTLYKVEKLPDKQGLTCQMLEDLKKRLRSLAAQLTPLQKEISLKKTSAKQTSIDVIPNEKNLGEGTSRIRTKYLTKNPYRFMPTKKRAQTPEPHITIDFLEPHRK